MKISIPESEYPRLVIIGGGFAGINLAKSLKKEKLQIVMLDRNNYHCFQPLLYQVASSLLEPDAITYPIRKIFAHQKNFYFRMADVIEIKPDEKEIQTSVNELTYDYLVIATGARVNFFKNEGLFISSMPLKTLSDSLNLRSLVLQNFEKALVMNNERKQQGLMNYVIAGGGPTGVELAGALGEMKQRVLPQDFPELDFSKMNIFLIQSNERLLPHLSTSSSDSTKIDLEKLGVTVILKTRVLDFFGDYVQTNQGDDIVARTLIWTAGVEGNSPKGLGHDQYGKQKRILVDEFNQVKGHEEIFAIGDIALMQTESTPNGHPMVAPAAIQQAENLAKNFQNIFNDKPLNPFEYKDKGMMATIGKNKAVVEIGNLKLKGVLAWLIWSVVHVASLIGFRNKVAIIINWIVDYIKSDKSMRVIHTPFDLTKEKRKRKDVWSKTN